MKLFKIAVRTAILKLSNLILNNSLDRFKKKWVFLLICSLKNNIGKLLFTIEKKQRNLRSATQSFLKKTGKSLK
jgi:hypothetical protein